MQKVCVNHPESPAVGSCKACEKPVCLMCIVELQGVSFCSEACGSAYQEVKDWLERPAADEEWNPLADSKPKTEAAPAAEPAAAAPFTDSGSKGPSGTEMRDALSSAFEDSDSGKSDVPVMGSSALTPPPGPNRAPLYIAIAATLALVVGAIFLLNAPHEEPPAPPPIAKVDPPKVEPAKVDPPKPEPVKVEPPKPVPKPEPAKVDPPKPEPVKVEPPKPAPKPEPVKVEPPKPEPAKVEPPKPAPKPEPAKVDPPKPEIAKVDPPKPAPKPEPAKVEPPKPEPAKVEPPKPEPAKVEPPKPAPKPEPAKVEPPKPEPAKVTPPAPKPEPPPGPHLAFVRDPWGTVKAGTWYRIKTTANGQDSYRDVGLRETGAGYRVLVSQTSAGGKTEPEQFTWTEPEEVSVFGSVNGDAQGAKYAADVVRTKPSRPSLYVFKDGPHAGASFSSETVLTKLEQQTLKIKDRDFPCSVIETEAKDPTRLVKTWFSTQVPLGVVKSESAGTTSAIVDFGDDWAKRPPFPEAPAPVIAKVDPPKPVVPPPQPPPKPEPPKPEPPKPEPPKPEPPKPEPVKPPPPKPEPAKVEPPKPEPPKPEPPKPEPVKPEPPKPDPVKDDATLRVKKSMSDAAGLIREATPIYQEVAGAVESQPSDKASALELLRKAERARMKLGDAKILYTSVKSDAPDPAVLSRRIAQLDQLLSTLQDYTARLKKWAE